MHGIIKQCNTSVMQPHYTLMIEERMKESHVTPLTWSEYSCQSYGAILNNTVDKHVASCTLYSTTNAFIRILNKRNSL